MFAVHTSVRASFRVAALAAGAILIAASAATPARADCQEDIGGFMKRRDGVIAQLNALTGGKKKQLDPIAACPKVRALSGIRTQAVAYLEKNKDWCAVPDQLLDGAKQQRAQFSSTAAKACGIAAKVQQMKQQAEKQGAMGGPQVQRMPTGPL